MTGNLAVDKLCGYLDTAECENVMFRVIFEYQHGVQDQSRTLAETGAVLLPKLISAQVQVGGII